MPSAIQFDFDNEDSKLTEGRVITAFYSDCVIVAVYSPASKEDGDARRVTFDSRLADHVASLVSKLSLPVMILGDLNVPPTDNDISEVRNWLPENRSFDIERGSFERLLRCGGVADVTKGSPFTWHPEPNHEWQLAGVGQRIDFTLLPKGFWVTDIQVRDMERLSDHRPVVVSFYKTRPTPAEFGLRRIAELAAGFDVSLFEGLETPEFDTHSLEAFQVCVQEHRKLRVRVCRSAAGAFVPRWNGQVHPKVNDVPMPNEF